MKEKVLKELSNKRKSFAIGAKKDNSFLEKLYEKINNLGDESHITFSKNSILIHGENINGLPLYGKIVFKELYDSNSRVEIKDESGKIRKGFTVDTTIDTTSGYGPLLYDLLIEHISKKSGFLSPDPRGVSNDAYQVWSIYIKERKDVKRVDFHDIQKENLNLDYEYDEVFDIFKAFYKDNMEITNLANKNIKR